MTSLNNKVHLLRWRSSSLFLRWYGLISFCSSISNPQAYCGCYFQIHDLNLELYVYFCIAAPLQIQIKCCLSHTLPSSLPNKKTASLKRYRIHILEALARSTRKETNGLSFKKKSPFHSQFTFNTGVCLKQHTPYRTVIFN